jgi:pyruvate dehydrogenase E2 component (dihydrolipoamide acetyltransferase)
VHSVIMPQIGQDITVGQVVRWHKRRGERVKRGEVILTVESEKASFEVEAEHDGVLLAILRQEGEEAEVLSAVGWIGEPGEAPPEVEAGGAATPGGAEVCGAAAPGGPRADDPTARAKAGAVRLEARDDLSARESAGSRRSGGAPCASPSARRVAAERGVPLEGIAGSGPGGRIVKQDVLRAAAAGEGNTVIPFSGVRRIAAERLALSSRTIPHFHLFQEIDMGAALVWREEHTRGAGRHLTITALVAHAAVQALGAFPRLNAHVAEDRLTLKAGVDLGLAVDTDRGLVVPVLPSAERLSLDELGAALARLSADARRGRLDPGIAGSFTVSSLGMHGVPAFLPLINPPECAILGLGAVEDRVAVRDGRVAVRPLMTVVLGCDHRAVDGAQAAAFLGELKRRLESGFAGLEPKS